MTKYIVTRSQNGDKAKDKKQEQRAGVPQLRPKVNDNVLLKSSVPPDVPSKAASVISAEMLSDKIQTTEKSTNNTQRNVTSGTNSLPSCCVDF